VDRRKCLSNSVTIQKPIRRLKFSSDHSETWNFPSLSSDDFQGVDNEDSRDSGITGHKGATNQRNVEYQKLLEEKYQIGYDQGKRESEEILTREYNDQIKLQQESINSILNKIYSQHLQSQEIIERDSLKLIIAIAERVIRREVLIDDQIVLRQIQEAMRRVSGIDRLKLRINPQDESLIKSHRNEIVASGDAVHELVIETDDTIEKGGCVLESDAGNVDARLSTQLKQIEAALISESSEEELIQ
jgi:flagellar assembly protein FliH